MPHNAGTGRSGAETEDDDDGPSRTTGRHPITIPITKATTRPWPGRMLLAVAALLLLAVAVVGFGMKLVGSDDDGQRPTSGEAEGPTGFYIPGDLPSGWKVSGVGPFYSEAGSDGISPFIACPCSFTEAEAAWDGSGRSRRAWYEEVGEVRMVVWRTAVGSRAVASTSMDRGALEALAKAWTSDKPPVLGGFRITDSWAVDHPITKSNGADWNIGNAKTGQYMSVSIKPKMLWYSLLPESTAALPGNGLHAGLLSRTQDVVASGRGHSELLASSYTGDGTAPLDPAILQTILGSFKAVDAATWDEHWRSAVHDLHQHVLEEDVRLRTDRISDWLEGPAPDIDMPQRSTEVIQGDPDNPVAAITVESTVDRLALVAGEQFTIGLTITNRTGATLEVSGCSFGNVTWSLIDEHGFVTPAGGLDVFCDSGPQPWPDGEQRRQTFDFPGQGQSMPGEGPIAAVIDFGDDLRHEVIVVIPGQVGL